MDFVVSNDEEIVKPNDFDCGLTGIAFHLDLEKHKERIEKQFNDMIEYDPKTNTEIEKLMTKQTLFSLQTQMQLSNVVKIMHANLRLQGDMLELIRNTFKESNQEIKKSKSKIKQKPPTYIG